MSCAEHYFENLLFYGKDVRDEPNKKHLSEIEEKTKKRIRIKSKRTSKKSQFNRS